MLVTPGGPNRTIIRLENDSMANKSLTAEKLRTLVEYDESTGLFTWKYVDGARPCVNSRKAGKTAGSLHSEGYLTINIDRRNLYAHRLAWLYFYGEWPRGIIDHINGNRRDNRISNLRDTTRSVNVQNYRSAAKNSKSGLLGAYYHKKSGKFKPEITISGVRLRLGVFDTAEAAHDAYIKAKRSHHPGCTI